jgi:hypothetical protein
VADATARVASGDDAYQAAAAARSRSSAESRPRRRQASHSSRTLERLALTTVAFRRPDSRSRAQADRSESNRIESDQIGSRPSRAARIVLPPAGHDSRRALNRRQPNRKHHIAHANQRARAEAVHQPPEGRPRHPPDDTDRRVGGHCRAKAPPTVWLAARRMLSGQTCCNRLRDNRRPRAQARACSGGRARQRPQTCTHTSGAHVSSGRRPRRTGGGVWPLASHATFKQSTTARPASGAATNTPN